MEGARALAMAVIAISLEDLGSRTVAHDEAVFFFESAVHLGLFCGLSGLDQLSVYNAYRRLDGKDELDRLPGQSYGPGVSDVVRMRRARPYVRKGIRIYRGGIHVGQADTVAQAVRVTGLSARTVYDCLRTGRRTGSGWSFTGRSRCGDSPGAPRKAIEILRNGIPVGTAMGAVGVFRAVGLPRNTVYALLRTGGTDRRGFSLRYVT